MDRSPYEMQAERALVSANPNVLIEEGLLQVGVDKPFEVHRVIPRIYARTSGNVFLATQPDQELLAGLVKISIKNTGLDLSMTKNPSRIGALTKGSSERTWEWAEPMTITRTNGFAVSLEADTFPAVDTLNNLLVVLTFEGFLLVVAPAMENR